MPLLDVHWPTMKQSHSTKRPVRKGLRPLWKGLSKFLAILLVLMQWQFARLRVPRIDRQLFLELKHKLHGCPILFSVIIPSCNEPIAQLERAIVSFVKQGVMDMSQIFVVDDACRDSMNAQRLAQRLKNAGHRIVWQSAKDAINANNTYALTSKCTPGTISFVRHERNRGLSASRNTGVQLSHGLYVWPLDADDYLTPFMVSELLRSLKTSGIDLFDPEQINVIMPGMGDTHGRLLPWQPKSLHGSDITSENIFHCCGLIRRDVFTHVKYNEALIFGWEDWDFWMKMQSKVGIKEYILPGPWYIYSSSGSSASMRTFCVSHHDICMAILRLANAYNFPTTQLEDDRRLLGRVSPEIWQMNRLFTDIVRSPHGNALATELARIVPQELIISNEKHRHLALDHSTALTDYHELMALIDAARESGLICFHQVLSSCIDKSHIRLAVHSMMSILKADMRSFIILHVLPAALHCVPRALNDIFFPRRIYVSVVELDTLARRSSSEEVLTLLSSAKVTKYPYYYSHITDYIRFAILFCFGGVYLDTDIILLKNPYGFYNVGMESEGITNGAFLSFEAEDNFLRACLDTFVAAYDATCWGCVGPALISAVLNQTKLSLPSVPVKVARVEAFYKYHWSEAEKMKLEAVSDEEFENSHIYGYHLWNKMGSYTGAVPGSVVFRLLKTTCFHESMQKCSTYRLD